MKFSKTLFTFTTILVLTLSTMSTSHASVGDLDSEFADSGVLTIAESGVQIDPQNMLVDAEDRIILFSRYNDGITQYYYVSRYLFTGEIDTSFGDNGYLDLKTHPDLQVILSFNMLSSQIASDGSIFLLVSESIPETYKIVKISADGEFVNDFGTNGVVTFDLLPSTTEYPSGFDLDSNGDLIVAAYNINYFYVVRADGTNGSIDPDFAQLTGMYIDDFITFSPDSLNARSIKLDSTDQIYIAGEVTKTGEDSVFVTRLTADGEFDATFSAGDGDNGHAIESFVVTGIELVNNMEIDSSDRPVLFGIFNNGADNISKLIRFTTSGELDATFGTAGVTDINIVIGSDQAAGLAINDAGIYTLLQCPAPDSVCLSRFDTNGVGDNEFGTSSVLMVAQTPTIDEIPVALALTSKGRIVTLTQYNSSDIATVVNRFATEQADLVVSLEADATEALTTENITFTVTIENQGHFDAESVVLTGAPSAGSAIVSDFSEVDCVDDGNGIFSCNLNTIATGSSVTITFVASELEAGTFTYSVNATTANDDSLSANNVDTASATITAPVTAGDDDTTGDDTTGDDDDTTDDDTTASSSGGCSLNVAMNQGSLAGSALILMNLGILLLFKKRKS